MQVTVAEGGNEEIGAIDQASPSTTWQGTVAKVEPDYGRHIQLVHFESGGHRLVGQADVRARIAQGEKISARFDETQLHLFEGESGRRIT